MKFAGLFKQRIPAIKNFLVVAKMDCAGRQQVQPGMQMLVVVPVHEFNDETFRVFDAYEVFRLPLYVQPSPQCTLNTCR